MMKVVLLGTGGPRPDPRRHGSALVVRIGDENLLFDAGRGVVLQLVQAGIPLARVNPVFLTHHHYDHIGDLGDLILTTWLQGRPGALGIFGPQGTADIVTALFERVYANDIRFRAEGEPVHGGWKPVNVTDIGPGLVHEAGPWQVSAEFVEHGHGLGIPDFAWFTVGYRLEAEGKVLAISGDCVPCEGLDRLARGADMLVQCCFLAEAEVTNAHLQRVARYTLATSGQVGKVATRGGVKTLVLTHFREKSDAMMQSLAEDVRKDYHGRLVLGEDLMELEL